MPAYKDSLFRSLFDNEKNFLSLYNAVTGANYSDGTTVKLNTLRETLFTSKKNDVSAIIGGKLIVVAEHQSSINGNMPFRFLSYAARLLENALPDKTAIYRTKVVKLPRPEFIVLYNGTAEYHDRAVLKLSDAFEQIENKTGTDLELIVQLVNINKGRNDDMLQKCEPLGGYVEFVDLVRARQKEIQKETPGITTRLAEEAAIAYAVSYSRKQGLLKEYFEKLLPEEVNMLAQEWSVADELTIAREEGWESGHGKGLEEGWERGRGKGLEEGQERVLNLIGQVIPLKELENLKKMLETSAFRQ
ncbi:MAG: Rpn family recombination-promoting nuclease/putative transposase [Spirochaetaceae bacterium]|jgi:hypothetical protein|nr:Rpn family recombination-promoting nuclease/putative transposase [Spirochaetaceae bacterium]